MNSWSLPAAADELGDRVALCIDGRTCTFAELAESSPAGDELPTRRAIVAERRLEVVISALHTLCAGRSVVPIPADLPVSERRRWAELVHASATGDPPSKAPRAPDEAAVLFTSGTTGRPKGVILTRSSLEASAHASEAVLGWRDDDRWLSPLSWAQMGGFSVLVRCLLSRHCAALCAPDTRSIARALAAGTTLASLVPPQLERLLDDPQWRCPPQVRAVLLGGGAASHALIERARDRGVPVCTTYGMTETSSQVATTPPGVRPPRGAVGRVVPGAQVEIDDGEIVVTGPMVMYGYVDEAPCLGRHRTGDLGALEGGWLRVIGRVDDRINSGGVPVDPALVEDGLAETSGVHAICVFGLPDPTWGHIVGAAVVMEAGADEASVVAAIVARARQALRPAHRPRRLRLVQALPLSRSGKWDRRALASDTRGPWIELRYSEAPPVVSKTRNP